MANLLKIFLKNRYIYNEMFECYFRIEEVNYGRNKANN